MGRGHRLTKTARKENRAKSSHTRGYHCASLVKNTSVEQQLICCALMRCAAVRGVTHRETSIRPHLDLCSVVPSTQAEAPEAARHCGSHLRRITVRVNLAWAT